LVIPLTSVTFSLIKRAGLQSAAGGFGQFSLGNYGSGHPVFATVFVGILQGSVCSAARRPGGGDVGYILTERTNRSPVAVFLFNPY